MYPKGNLFIPVSHGQLEAVLKLPKTEPKGAALVLHPHPLGGGTMHNKVVYRAAAGLLEAGLAALRINFRGVGRSTGQHDDGVGELDDIRAALEYLSDELPGRPVTLAGFSFGSFTGSQVALEDDRITRLISIGTPVGKYDFSHMKNLRIPVLYVHGDRDEFGTIEDLNKLVALVSENTETAYLVFENCGHFFDNHLTQLKNAIHDWVLEKLAEEAGA